jgi:type I restriction enzyme S subunit
MENVSLGTVASVKSGFAFKSRDWKADGVPVIKIANVKDGFVTLDGCSFVDEAVARSAAAFELKAGDILISMTGYIGEVARVRNEGRMLLNQRVGKFSIRNASKLDNDFLFYCLRNPEIKAKFAAHAYGAAQPNISPSLIEQQEIPLPPLSSQRRIAGILSAYDELIENSQRRIKILEAMARALYREWFVDFRFPGHESVPRIPSPLGEIPKGWEGTVGDIAAIERAGINPFDFPGEEFEHFSIPAFDDGRTPAVERGEAILSNKYGIDNSCVLLSKLNPRIPRIWLPAPTGTRRAITSTEFLVLKPKTGFSREFIYAKCCSEEFAGHFASLAIGTSTSHQRVRPENVLAMPSTAPSREVVEQFTRLVAPILAVSEKLRAKVQNLRRTRDLLLPRLLSGQIDVEAFS